MDEVIGEAKWEVGIRMNGGIQGIGEKNPRRKDQVAWRNVGEDRERFSRVMAGARLRAKKDAVAVKMKVGGGGLGERKEEDRKRRRRHQVKFDEFPTV